MQTDRLETGIYELSDLTTPRTGPSRRSFPRPRANADTKEKWGRDVFAIAIDPDCEKPLSPKLRAQFERVAVRNSHLGRSHEIWLRFAQGVTTPEAPLSETPPMVPAAPAQVAPPAPTEAAKLRQQPIGQ